MHWRCFMKTKCRADIIQGCALAVMLQEVSTDSKRKWANNMLLLCVVLNRKQDAHINSKGWFNWRVTTNLGFLQGHLCFRVRCCVNGASWDSVSVSGIDVSAAQGSSSSMFHDFIGAEKHSGFLFSDLRLEKREKILHALQFNQLYHGLFACSVFNCVQRVWAFWHVVYLFMPVFHLTLTLLLPALMDLLQFVFPVINNKTSDRESVRLGSYFTGIMYLVLKSTTFLFFT